jgi:predicted DsbA family dithiol-disulfide isomerase
MSKPMKIDFVSDVSCPWCIIGLRGLETALERVGDLVTPEIHFQPFELNPAMPEGGQDMAEHLQEKYGSTPEQSASNGEMIRERAAGVGFAMAPRRGSRIYNTFDAHRLLHWAGLEGRQQELKHQLFTAYFTDGQDPGDTEVLIDAAGKAGLDRAEAAAVLASGRYADDVRAAERDWQAKGITSVPAVIVNDRYLISGGQPPEAFEQAIRTIAAEG